MFKKRFFTYLTTIAILLLTLTSFKAYAEEIKIIIMQDDKGAAERFQPLMDYLKKKDIPVKLIGAPNYSTAAQMFKEGKGDAMFSGSGVAATLIIKQLASPLVRPVSKDGVSTYKAFIIAPKGTPKYTGKAEYFSGKKVMTTAIASSGEFFFRAIPNIKNVNAKLLIAGSHGAAIDALAKGAADIAIVKDRVWLKKAKDYPNLEKVGEDKGLNPDNTLMVSKNFNTQLVSKLEKELLALENDASPEAKAAKEKLDIVKFIKTTNNDFKHTLELVKRAGVTPSFDFKF